MKTVAVIGSRNDEEGWRGPSAALVEAARWMSPQLVDPAVASGVRAAFTEGGRVPHVCLSDVLQPSLAGSVHEALGRARFVPHHHAPYPLSIARREEHRGRGARRRLQLHPALGGAFRRRARLPPPLRHVGRAAHPPLFNSVFIFRSRGAPHGVTQVTPEAGSHWRYTVTSFFLAGS